jgi:hypothetical protein
VAKTFDAIATGLAGTTRDPIEVAEAIVALVALPAGTRPLRTPVPGESPAAAINAAAAPIEQAVIEAYGLGHLLPALATAT